MTRIIRFGRWSSVFKPSLSPGRRRRSSVFLSARLDPARMVILPPKDLWVEDWEMDDVVLTGTRTRRMPGHLPVAGNVRRGSADILYSDPQVLSKPNRSVICPPGRTKSLHYSHSARRHQSLVRDRYRGCKIPYKP